MALEVAALSWALSTAIHWQCFVQRAFLSGPGNEYARWSTKYGRVFAIYVGSTPFIVVRDAEVAYEILVRQFNKFPGRDTNAAPLEGTDRSLFINNIVFAKDAAWSTVHTAAQRMYQSMSLRKFAPYICGAADRMVADLHDFISNHATEHAGNGDICAASDATPIMPGVAINGLPACVVRRKIGADKAGQYSVSMTGNTRVHPAQRDRAASTGNEVDMHCLLTSFCTELFAPTTLGLTPEYMVQSKHKLHDLVIEALTTVGGRRAAMSVFTLAAFVLPQACRPAIAWLSKHFPTPASARVQKDSCYSRMAALTHALTNAARRRYNMAITPPPHFVGQEDVMDIDAEPEEGSLMDLLARARDKDTKEPLSDIMIIPQTIAFLLPGSDNVGIVLSLAVYFIAQQPAVERTLRQELRQHARLALDSAEACEQLTYTQACIKETMRLMNIVPVTTRSAACDTVVQGWLFPQRVNVVIDFSGPHRDPRYWTDPDEFKPERFLGDVEPRHPHAFLGFGAGPRKCTAWRFAMQEMTIGLARLYQHFTFRLSPRYASQPLEMEFDLLRWPKGGVWVSVHPVATACCM